MSRKTYCLLSTCGGLLLPFNHFAVAQAVPSPTLGSRTDTVLDAASRQPVPYAPVMLLPAGSGDSLSTLTFD